MGIELEGVVHSLKISILDGGLNIKALAGNNPYKSNNFNRTFITFV